MVYRAIRKSSDYTLLHKELIFIRQIVISNGYPLPFVLHIIRTTLNRYFESNSNYKIKPSKFQQTSTDSKKTKQTILVDAPFVGRPSVAFGKKLINVAKQIEPSFHIQSILRRLPAFKVVFL
ncbi:unnamed protein product, partial [Adineta ricciae]